HGDVVEQDVDACRRPFEIEREPGEIAERDLQRSRERNPLVVVRRRRREAHELIGLSGAAYLRGHGERVARGAIDGSVGRDFVLPAGLDEAAELEGRALPRVGATARATAAVA